MTPSKTYAREPQSDPPFKVDPDQKAVMTWKTFWTAMCIVAVATAAYCSIKFEQVGMRSEQVEQGKHLESLDSRMANLERGADRQTVILESLARERRIPVPPDSVKP